MSYKIEKFRTQMVKTENDMEQMMHLAAQYLAAAGISFLKKTEDDSHTNLYFSTEVGTMFSRPLNEEGVKLSLNYQNFTLEWHKPNVSSSLQLDGSKHGEVLEWIEQMVASSNMKGDYRYKLHYDLPYKISDNYVFKLIHTEKLRELTHLRILAQLALETFLKKEGLKSEIRIWPHHFDTGAFSIFEDSSGRSIGMGLAIPDSLVSEHYFYMSGYQGQNSINTSKFNDLTKGTWHNNGFKGATLPSTGVNESTVVEFFSEALTCYKDQYDTDSKEQKNVLLQGIRPSNIA